MLPPQMLQIWNRFYMFHRKIDTKYKLLKCCHVNGGSKPPPYDLIDKRKFDKKYKYFQDKRLDG